MFSKIETNINNQIRRLEDMDIVNYFILAKIDRINQVLLAAAQENYFGKKYLWCAVTKVKQQSYENKQFEKLFLPDFIIRIQVQNHLLEQKMLPFYLPFQL